MSTKVILFLSTTLTAFVLATLYGVVTTIDTNPAPVQAAEMQAVDAQVEMVSQEFTAPVFVDSTELTPDKAALIAAEAISRQDVYSVELKTLENGVPGYEVVFSSNDVVFISMNSMVYSITSIQPKVVYTYTEPTQPLKVKASGSGNGNGNNNNNDDHNENESEHED